MLACGKNRRTARDFWKVRRTEKDVFCPFFYFADLK